MKIMDKRGISPIIATVLLIVVAIALFLLIFLWIRGFQKEVITKEGTPIEMACQEVSFDVVVTGSTVQIMNMGDLPIYKAKVFVVDGGTRAVGESEVIAQGSSVTVSSAQISGCSRVKVIPVLLGTNKEGIQREYICEKNAKIVSC